MASSLETAHAALQDVAAQFVAGAASMSTRDLANTVAAFEDISRTLDFLQVAGANAVERADIAANGETAGSTCILAAASGAEGAGWADPAAAITSTPGNPHAGGACNAAEGTGNAAVDGTGQRRRKTEFRNNAEYLRSKLQISIVEARRRLRVGAAVTAPVLRLDGEQGPAPLPVLARAMADGDVSGQAAAVVVDSIGRARHAGDRETLEAMEASLVEQAVETDADTLGMVAKTWETAVDQDGAEPSEEELRARQGMFYRGRRRGLHQFVINTTDDQYEALATVMNSAANPRIRPDAIETASETAAGSTAEAEGADSAFVDGAAISDAPGNSINGPGETGESAASTAAGSSDENQPEQSQGEVSPAVEANKGFGVDPAVVAGMDGFTRAQKLLAGLVGACRIALNVGKLPDSGGHRTQVMVTTGYEQLAGLFSGGGSGVFNGPLSAKTIRRMACDAEIIPAVLGSKGEVLELGRSQRFFSRAIRRALVIRDKGCAFPGCTMPVLWTEAHHIIPWWAGGTTEVDNGVCLCTLHHDLVEHGNWDITVVDRIPWFIPPDYIDPDQTPMRNTYWQTQIPSRELFGSLSRDHPKPSRT